MPRLRPTFSDFFYTPLTEDVEELLAYFQQSNSIRYEDFSAVWRQMGFSDVFIGIVSMAEQKRFSRVALATAVKYFLPPYSYQIRVGGLYLMFGLYHTQLSVPPVRIRLALKDWDVIQKFIKDSGDSGHQDVMYIYHKLVAAKAIHFTAMPHHLSFLKQRKQKKETTCAAFIGRSMAVQELLSADILEEVSYIESQYENMKVEVKCEANMTQRDFTTRLKDCMAGLLTWQQKTFSQDNKDNGGGDDDEDDDDDDDDEDEDEVEREAKANSTRARLISSIKQKSYSNFQEESKDRMYRQPKKVESSSSGTEQRNESGRRKRPPSLRARTWKSLGVTRDESRLQAWLLSAPEQKERVPVKRINQKAPFVP